MVVKWRERREVREFITLLPCEREARKTIVGLRCANIGEGKEGRHQKMRKQKILADIIILGARKHDLVEGM